MKRTVVLCAGILMVALIPGLASAQGSLLPGFPSFGSNGCGSCYGGIGGVAIGADVAYVGYSRSTTFELTSQGQGLLLGHTNFRQGYPVHGIQLSGMATVSANDRVTLIARGTWLLPWNGESYETRGMSGGILRLERTWTTSTQWWTAEGAGAWALNDLSAVVAGLRYDSLQTNFSDPTEPSFFLGQTGDADLQVDLWIPYVGAIVQQGPVRFGVIGFPWVPGHMRYRETHFFARLSGSGTVKNGYFLEAFGEFNTSLMVATAGIFAKWTLVRVKASGSADDKIIADGSLNDTFDLVFDRPNWILGAQAALSFSSPF